MLQYLTRENTEGWRYRIMLIRNLARIMPSPPASGIHTPRAGRTGDVYYTCRSVNRQNIHVQGMCLPSILSFNMVISGYVTRLDMAGQDSGLEEDC